MDKNRDTFERILTEVVNRFISESDKYGDNPQISVIPADHSVSIVSGDDMLSSIADSEEELDNASGALGLASADAADYQATRNPDFYPAWQFVKDSSGVLCVDVDAVRSVADVYYE